jgi:hypothetical protein
MDFSKPIIYRSVDINNAVLETGRTLRGIAVESVDYSDVENVGYTEKRAAADGLHASDVYLGARGVDLSGHVYATSLAELFDYLHILRATFSPTSAYQEDPGNRGFLPMEYQQPTLDTENFPGGVIPLYMNLRPRTSLRFNVFRDRLDASKRPAGPRPTATAWSAQLWAKDPRVYIIANPSPGSRFKTIDIAGGPHATTPASAVNRGDYETPMNILLAIGAAPGAAKNFKLTGLNGIDMTITIENKANTVYRWFGDDRVLMTQDTSAGPDVAPFILRMDLVSFATKNRRPSVPASINPPTKPFATALQYSTTAVLAAGSRLFWSEAFA